MSEEDEYEFTITIQVTAESVEQAAEHALDDLRDPTMYWTDYRIRNTRTGETTIVGVVTTNPEVRERAAIELDEAGWPSVAQDLRAGIPATTIARRLRDIGEEGSPAYLIVSEIDD